MAAARKEKFMDSVVTKSPRGVGIWAHIAKPDTYEGKETYCITLKLPKEGAPNQADIDAFLEKIEDFRQIALKKGQKDLGKKFAEGTNPVKDGDEREWKGEGDNPYAGHWLLQFKSKYQPKVVDAKGGPLTAVYPSGGDIVRVGAELVPYAAPTKAIGVGVSLRMLGVQIIEKRARGADVDWSDESGETGANDESSEDVSGSGPDL